MIVADTNLLVHLLLPGERGAVADEVFQRDPEWVAPLLWRSEFRNVLAKQIRRGTMALAEALQVTENAERRMIGCEFLVPSAPVLSLATVSGCSAYDCEFVALAQLLNVRLLTADRQVLTAFPGIAISPEGFIASPLTPRPPSSPQ